MLPKPKPQTSRLHSDPYCDGLGAKCLGLDSPPWLLYHLALCCVSQLRGDGFLIGCTWIAAVDSVDREDSVITFVDFSAGKVSSRANLGLVHLHSHAIGLCTLAAAFPTYGIRHQDGQGRSFPTQTESSFRGVFASAYMQRLQLWIGRAAERGWEVSLIHRLFSGLLSLRDGPAVRLASAVSSGPLGSQTMELPRGFG